MLLSLILSVAVSAANPFENSQWIGAPWDGEEFICDAPALPSPEFLREIEIPSRVKSAKVYVTGVGFYEFFINGEKVGDEVLSPNETSYCQRGEALNGDRIKLSGSCSISDKDWKGYRILYRDFDVTKMLKKGKNTLGAMLGNGFFATASRRWVSPYGTPRFICDLRIELADGTTMNIVSDDSWSVRRGPIVLNDMYDGEIYDAREADGVWEQAAVRKAPGGRLLPQDGPADRVVGTLKPKTIKKLDDGSYEVDFGDYISGWVRLRNFQLPQGESIDIDFPIETSGNGTYKYISDGSYVKEYAPRFTWWVFRTAIVKGWPGELTAKNIVAEIVNSDVEKNASFKCSNPLFNRMNAIWQRTMTDNMHLGVSTDCPHREKGPYTGDLVAACVTVLHNFDVKTFYSKWLHDISDCQDTVTGYVPNGAPWHPGCGGGVAWGAAMEILPWEHYMRYGDLTVLEENFSSMKEHVRFLESWRLEDGTMLQAMPMYGQSEPFYWLNLGEWCPSYNLVSENLVHTWYLWRCADYTAKAAAALGLEEDEACYKALAEDVAGAFHRKFWNGTEGTYDGGVGILASDGYGTGDGGGMGDGANIFALAMGVPAERYDAVCARIRAEFEANDGHLNTGIYGTGLLGEVLCDNGMADLAYGAMNKRDFPSYGWWIEQGADTFWEQWNGTASRNHPMMGGGLIWFYRRLAGLSALEPGYKRILFRPTPCGDLTWASYSLETENGKASIYWKFNRHGRLVVKTVVPSGSSAVLEMPDGSKYELVSGRSIHKSNN